MSWNRRYLVVGILAVVVVAFVWACLLIVEQVADGLKQRRRAPRAIQR